MSGVDARVCAQVLDILRAQSADELEEAVSEWTEVRPATAATAGFALTGKSRALSRFQSRATFFERGWFGARSICERFADDLRKSSKPLFPATAMAL